MTLPVYLSRNGVLVPPAEAVVSVFTPALYGAYGVYESLKIVNGVPFEAAAHLRRLARSAEILGLPLPADLMTFHRWIADTIKANGVPTCTLRIFVVGPENGGEAIAFIWPQPLPEYPQEYYTQGVSTLTFEGCRYLPRAKSLNSLVSFLAQRAARAAGSHEAFLYCEGYLTEGSNSNLFAVVDDIVLTPPAEGVLSGVTRDIVIALAAAHGIPLRESLLPRSDMGYWSECFITSTSRHIMPVTLVDGMPVGDGAVGPIARRLMTLFEAYFAEALRAAEALSDSAPPVV